MSTFVYRCPKCKTDFTVREPFGSTPYDHICTHGDLDYKCYRVPQLANFIMKGTGFTRVSTNPENNRKLSPWFGGSPENAPDYKESVEFKYERDKIIKEGGGDSQEMRALSIEAEKATISAVENKLGNNVYGKDRKEEYFKIRSDG